MPLTPEERARISRENGAKSKGPKTEEGKAQSRRNAITHGQRAEALKLFVPPHSAVLLHEDRRVFYDLLDTNVAKYQPGDDPELAVVREITDLQWSNLRVRTALHALLNRELLRTADKIVPLVPEHATIENTVAAYESVATSPAVRLFRAEFASNTRLIMALERRLAHIQRHWPSNATRPVSTEPERALYEVPAPENDERTQKVPAQPVENTSSEPKRRAKFINVRYPLTPEKIRLYRTIFPNRDLEFNVYGEPEAEPEPSAA